MGASASASVTGVSSASDTSWGWWGVAGAKAATYTFTGSAIADGVKAPPPTTIGPLAKFGAGAAGLTPIVFMPLSLAATGAKGSSAQADARGASNAGVFFYGANVAVSAIAGAAPGGAASASADAKDPWDLKFQHRPGRKSYAVVPVTIDPTLAPARGASSFRVFGSFGEVGVAVGRGDKKARAGVALNPGWQVYKNARPPQGPIMRAPGKPLTKASLATLLAKQYDAKSGIWTWRQAPPTLTFVKEVPASVASERIEVGIGVSDEDAADERRPRGRARAGAGTQR